MTEPLSLFDSSIPRRPDDEILRDVRKLIDAHRAGILGGETMPEDALIGAVPESDLMDVITLAMALNYQRNSYALWRSVAECYGAEEDRWVFVPSATGESVDALREVLVRRKVALQPNKHVGIWSRISESLEAYGGAVRLIERSECKVGLLRNIVCVDDKRNFPYLSGPKIFNYWVYVLEQYCGVRWIDREEISIAPDTHVIQASMRIGLFDADVSGVRPSSALVAESWVQLLSGSEIAPIDVHTPLWLWSRSGFPDLDLPDAVDSVCIPDNTI